MDNRRTLSRMKKIHVVAGVIHRKDTVLIAQRSETMSAPLCWEFPGGKVEKGESEEHALKRELKEELDVDVVVGDFLARSRVVHQKRSIDMLLYACTLKDCEPVAKEHAQLKWVPNHSLKAYRWAPADIPVIDHVEAWLKGNCS